MVYRLEAAWRDTCCRTIFPPTEQMDMTEAKIFRIPKRRRLNLSGFSLVELMVAVAVIAVLALFTGPEILNWRENMRVGAAARDLFAGMNLGRVVAIERGESVVVNAVTGTNSYEIFVDDGDARKMPAKAGNGVRDSGLYDTDGDLLPDTPYQEEWITRDANNNAGVASLAGKSYKGTTMAATIANAGFTPKGVPLGGATGAIILRNSDSTTWYRIELTTSGSLRLRKSSNSTDGVDGSWE